MSTNPQSTLGKILQYGFWVAGIAGIVFGIWHIKHRNKQLQQHYQIEETNRTLEAIRLVRNKDFIRAYADLQTYAVSQGELPDGVSASQMTDELNLLLGTYEEVALYYLNGLVDTCLLINAVQNKALTFNEILTRIQEIERERMGNNARLQAIIDANTEQYSRFVHIINKHECP